MAAVSNISLLFDFVLDFCVDGSPFIYIFSDESVIQNEYVYHYNTFQNLMMNFI